MFIVYKYESMESRRRLEPGENRVTFSPSLKGGRPLYGHPLQRNASPSPHWNIKLILGTEEWKNNHRRNWQTSWISHTLPQEDWGLFNCSVVSPNFCTVSSDWALPQVQFLQAFLLLPTSQSPTEPKLVNRIFQDYEEDSTNKTKFWNILIGSWGFFKSSSVRRLSSSIKSDSLSTTILGTVLTVFFKGNEEPVVQEAFLALN